MNFLQGAALAFCTSALSVAQSFEYRGFLQTSAQMFPYVSPQDPVRLIADALLRVETGYRPKDWLSFEAGFDGRLDSHHQADRSPRLNWWDRRLQRPALSLRLASVTLRRGKFTAQAGKQVIRWGAVDILGPVDRFAPRDFLTVVDNEVLPVTALRLSYENHASRIEFVAAPRLTPSRVPLARQRWAPLPSSYPPDAVIVQPPPPYPNSPQFGLRWSRGGPRLDYALTVFDGHNHAPNGEQALLSVQPWVARITRSYPRLRMYGGDIVLPTRFAVIRAESAYFRSRPAGNNDPGDDYILNVFQVERQVRRWQWLCGYTHRVTTFDRRSAFFDPQRSLAGSFLGRLQWDWRSNISLALDGAVRRSGGAWLTRAELSRSWGRHWTTKVNFTWIYGSSGDFLGQFRRNTNAIISDRYTF